jgi:hypothetical protein
VRRAPTAGWDAFTSLTCERVLGRNVSPYISFAGALFEWSFVRRTKQGGGEEGGESFVSMGSRGGMIEMRLLTPYLSPPYLFVWLVVLVKREKVAVHFPLLLLFPPLHLSVRVKVRWPARQLDVDQLALRRSRADNRRS